MLHSKLKCLCPYRRHLFVSGHAYIPRQKEVILAEEGKVNHRACHSQVGHNTKNEAAVTLTLRMWRFYPSLYGCTAILTHFQCVNICSSLEYLVLYTVMTDDIGVAHDKEVICRCGTEF